MSKDFNDSNYDKQESKYRKSEGINLLPVAILIFVLIAFYYGFSNFDKLENFVNPFSDSTEVVENDEDKVVMAECKEDTEVTTVAATVENVVEERKEIVDEDYSEDIVFVRVGKQASYPGGIRKMMDYIKNNIQYPKDCEKAGIQGRVIVSFVVGKDGSINDVTVLRGVHNSLDAEAVRVVKSMPNWNPAENNGKKVRSKFTLPVFFRL
ncbi:MAG: energy transducer TonB [Bacteroidales bacterium]|nr:energy transducer TonB [Candidatus Scybalocola fimicaballi]